MINQWEEFPIGPNTADETLHVTLSRKGEILIGVRTFEKLGRPAAAILLFDRLHHMIGVLPSNHHAKNAYPLKSKVGGSHRLIRANKFCRHYGIRVDRTIAFGTPKINEDGILILDLGTTSIIGKPRVG